MTIYGILMALGGFAVAFIIFKGFWSGDRVESIKQVDNWQNGGDGPL